MGSNSSKTIRSQFVRWRDSSTGVIDGVKFAIENAEVESFMKFVEDSRSIDILKGEPLLHDLLGSEEPNERILRKLMEIGFNELGSINEIRNGKSPVMKASMNKNFKILEILYENGANVNLLNDNNESVLHVLCSMDAQIYENELSYLLQTRIDEILVNNRNQTARDILEIENKVSENIMSQFRDFKTTPAIIISDIESDWYFKLIKKGYYHPVEEKVLLKLQSNHEVRIIHTVRYDENDRKKNLDEFFEMTDGRLSSWWGHLSKLSEECDFKVIIVCCVDDQCEFNNSFKGMVRNKEESYISEIKAKMDDVNLGILKDKVKFIFIFKKERLKSDDEEYDVDDEDEEEEEGESDYERGDSESDEQVDRGQGDRSEQIVIEERSDGD